MDPKNPETENWSEADIAAMLTGRDERQASFPAYTERPVELSPGFHPDEGEYVIDPDYAEILSIDFDDLIRSNANLRR